MCGFVIIEGEIIPSETTGRECFQTSVSAKPTGTILKNNSENPRKWEGLCSECQKLQDKGGV